MRCILSTALAQQLARPQQVWVSLLCREFARPLSLNSCSFTTSHASCRKKRLHPSASPGRSLNEAQSTDVLKQAGGSGGLDGKVSGAGTSTGTPSHQHFGGRDSLRTLHSDMEGSEGQLLGQRSSDLSMPQIEILGLGCRLTPSEAFI